MIEKILLEHLSAALPVPVRMEVPEDPPGTFCVLEKTGGGCEEHLYTALVAVQSWAPTLLEAARLNEQVKAAMETACELDAIAEIRLNTDYNFTDTSTRYHRYQAVFDLVHY
ncbi:MAG: hypothetical protein IJ484_09545 [Oscillospiraceae bacterium]|nr:hypothetical protein [Oscillospiraceae bacterium]